MANVFTTIAHKATSLSELMEGRDKIGVDDVMAQYPEGITIIGFDIITSNLNNYPIIIFAEDKTKYMNGGTILGNICEEWAKAYEGDIDAASKALNAVGGVHVKFSKSRTKSGNNITLVDIID